MHTPLEESLHLLSGIKDSVIRLEAHLHLLHHGKDEHLLCRAGREAFLLQAAGHAILQRIEEMEREENDG